jgi:hypothetical protein
MRHTQPMSPGRRIRTVATLLACAIALLCSAAAALAKTPHGTACRSSQTTHGEHTCPAHHSAVHKHHKAEHHHAKHHSSKRAKAKQEAKHALAPALEAATCEDGSTPAPGAEGSYACADGSEPECADGSEPILAPHKAQLLCPAASSGAEWSEASCEDGSDPTQASSGDYLCEDGSAPACEDGSAPVAPEEGSQLACIEEASQGSSHAPAPAASEEEAEEEGATADFAGYTSARVASAS